MGKFLELFGTTVHFDKDGRYSLNDIHKAAMHRGYANESHRPGNFLRNDGVKEFVNSLGKYADHARTTKGRYGKTYATEPVMLEYVLWMGGSEIKSALYNQISDAKAIIDALMNIEVPDDLPDLYVYAIREVDTKNVKIGISKNPQDRLNQLQTGNSHKLEIVAMCKAENRFKDEKALHHANSAHHIHGEWFATIDSESINPNITLTRL